MAEVDEAADMDKRPTPLKRFYDILKLKFFEYIENALVSMGDFERNLARQLTNLTELTSEILKENASLAMQLCKFEKDVCATRDYFKKIISSTETLVKYGSNQELIQHITRCFENERYSEAQTEINIFLRNFERLIDSVKKDIADMHNAGCNVDLEKVRKEFDQFKQSSSAAMTVMQDKIHAVSQKHDKVFELGSTTLVCMMAGATTGVVIASYLPEELSTLSQMITSGGSEVASFCADRILKGLGSIKEEASLTDQLRKTAESINDILRHLLGFFFKLNDFEININSIHIAIAGLERDIGLALPIDNQNEISLAGWTHQVGILKKMLHTCNQLNSNVIKSSKAKIEEFDDVLEKLETISSNLASS